MPDMPASVGVLTVTGQLLNLVADSIDPDERPDARVPVAKVHITANAPTPLVAVAEQVMFTLDDIDALLDGDGRLVAPADGKSGTAGTEAEIRLVAPIQAAISDIGWQWQFTFTALAPSTFKTFTVYVTGQAGDEVNLSAAVLAGHVASLTAQPVVWVQVGVDLPAEIRPGQFLLDTTNPATPKLYLYASRSDDA